MKTFHMIGTFAVIAITVAACSTPPPQQTAASATRDQALPQGQSPAVPPDNAAAPANSTNAPEPGAASDAARRTAAPPAAQAPAPAPAAAAPVAAPAPAPPPPQPPKPRVARLNAGHTITIRTTRALSTKTIKTGDVFSAILEEPIKVDNWVVVPAGARTEGRIVTSDDGGRLKGKANLAIELTGMTTGDGQKVEIVTSPVTAEAQANKGKEVKKVGIGAGAGAAVGAIAGGGKGAAIGALIGGGAGAAMKGDAAEIPAESVVSFELRSPVTIQEKK